MRRLYYQFYLTIVVSLVLVVVVGSGLWRLVERDAASHSRHQILGELVAAALAPADAPPDEQRAVLRQLARRLATDLTLYDSNRQPIAVAGDSLSLRIDDNDGGRRYHEGGRPVWTLRLPDGRWIVARLSGQSRFSDWRIAFILGGIALAVAIAALPLARRITRRLERLQLGVESLGAGDLAARVKVEGRDEVARLATSFNNAAARIEELVGSHKMLLANASHELRTPLARIRMAVELLNESADPVRKAALEQDIAELDRLIEEILLASRLDADTDVESNETIDLLALAAEEASRYENCDVSGVSENVVGDANLLRRLVRNLLDNASRYGRPPVRVVVARDGDRITLSVCDRGPGVRAEDREAIFQPFFRGQADRSERPGSGLGLTLVRQIAQRHGGTVACREAEGETCFVVSLASRQTDSV